MHALQRALVAYRARTGTFPAHLDNGPLPPHGNLVKKSCEHPDFNVSYDRVMAELTSLRLLDAPLAHPDRRPKDLGYCFMVYRDNGKDTWVLWASLGASTLSNRGEPATCRPFDYSVAQLGYCERDLANQDYCLCLQ